MTKLRIDKAKLQQIYEEYDCLAKQLEKHCIPETYNKHLIEYIESRLEYLEFRLSLFWFIEY